MTGFAAIAKRISNPPGAQNFARLNVMGDEAETTNLIARFATSVIPFNYNSGLKQCQTHVQLGLTVDTAVAAVLQCGAPMGRSENAALVRAFFDYDAERAYSKSLCVDSYLGDYRISRDVRVPTKPTFTILEGGRLVPVTVCGWKSLPLNVEQIRFWLTMMEDGLYSHSDYRTSPAEILLFIEHLTEYGKVRRPFLIKRGDYELLSPALMREQADLFTRAQAAALPIAEARWNEQQERRKQEEPVNYPRGDRDDDQPSMFP